MNDQIKNQFFILLEYGFKSPVYCELSYTFSDNKKTVYFSVYQNRKCRKLIHKFVIDSSKLY
jgi:hypothetical protein